MATVALKFTEVSNSAEELAEIVRPFVGLKRNPPRDPSSRYGGYLPQTAAIDILHTRLTVNADVRDVTSRGVVVFFYDHSELIEWDAIRNVTVRSLDADGQTIGASEYGHVSGGSFLSLVKGQKAFARSGLA